MVDREQYQQTCTEKMSRKRFYLFCSSVIFSMFGLILILQAISFGQITFSEVGNAHQVNVDWGQQPYVGITITDETSCPDGSDLLFYRMWQGTKLWCVCN